MTWPEGAGQKMQGLKFRRGVVNSGHFVEPVAIRRTVLSFVLKTSEMSKVTLYIVLDRNDVNCYHYTGCSLIHGTNFDSLYKNPKITLLQE